MPRMAIELLPWRSLGCLGPLGPGPARGRTWSQGRPCPRCWMVPLTCEGFDRALAMVWIAARTRTSRIPQGRVTVPAADCSAVPLYLPCSWTEG